MRRAALCVLLTTACDTERHVVAVVPCEKPPASIAPSGAPACRLRGYGSAEMFYGRYELFLSREAADPVAIVRKPNQVGVTWSDFPDPDIEKARAHVELKGKAELRFEGYAPLDGRGFTIVDRVDIVPGHVWVRAASVVEVRGERGGRMHVRGLEDVFEITTTCENLAYAPLGVRTTDDPRRKTGDIVYFARDTLSVAKHPQGCIETTIPRGWAGEVRSIESDEGWTHVVGGTESFVYDAWAPSSELTSVAPPTDRDFSDPPDDYDRCVVTASARSETDVTLSPDPGAPRIASLELGTVVTIEERKGDRVGFELLSGRIAAPEGKRFWVSADALGPATGDGCPE